MLTKVLAAVVLAGALFVAGDAAYNHFGCPFSSCSAPSASCIAPVSQPSECCSTKSESIAPVSECCTAEKTVTTPTTPIAAQP